MKSFARTKTAIAAAVLSVTALGAAQAATIGPEQTVTFSGQQPGSSSAQYMSGDVTVDVTASGGGIRNFDNPVRGIGVGDASNYSGFMKIGESLRFDFGSSVQLLSTSIFEALDGTDTVRVTNLGDNTSTQFTIVDGGDAYSAARFDLSFTSIGSSFLFETTASTGEAIHPKGGHIVGQGVLIQDISFSLFTASATTLLAPASAPISPVPLPASFPMLLAAFGGIFALRRRKTA